MDEIRIITHTTPHPTFPLFILGIYFDVLLVISSAMMTTRMLDCSYSFTRQPNYQGSLEPLPFIIIMIVIYINQVINTKIYTEDCDHLNDEPIIRTNPDKE